MEKMVFDSASIIKMLKKNKRIKKIYDEIMQSQFIQQDTKNKSPQNKGKGNAEQPSKKAQIEQTKKAEVAPPKAGNIGNNDVAKTSTNAINLRQSTNKTENGVNATQINIADSASKKIQQWKQKKEALVNSNATSSTNTTKDNTSNTQNDKFVLVKRKAKFVDDMSNRTNNLKEIINMERERLILDKLMINTVQAPQTNASVK